MESNAEKQKLLEEEEELKRLQALADKTEKAQEAIEKTLEQRKRELLEKKQGLAGQISELEREQSEILGAEKEDSELVQPEQEQVEEEVKQETPEVNPLLKDQVVKAHSTPDGNGTQVLMGEVADGFKTQITEPAPQENIESKLQVPETAQETQAIPVETSVQNTDALVPEQTQDTIKSGSENPHIEIIANNPSQANVNPEVQNNSQQIQPENSLVNEDNNFQNSVLSQFPEQEVNQSTELQNNVTNQTQTPELQNNNTLNQQVQPQIVPTEQNEPVGPSVIGQEQNASPVGDDGELLQPDFSFENNITSEEQKEGVTPVDESSKLKNEVEEVISSENKNEQQVNPEQSNITPASGGPKEESLPSAIHQTAVPMAANYRMPEQAKTNESVPNQSTEQNVRNVSNVDNSVNNNTENSVDSSIVNNSPENNINQTTNQVVSQEKPKEEEEENEKEKASSTGGGNIAGLPLPTQNKTIVEKVNKVENTIKTERAENSKPKQSSALSTSDIILILLLVISVVLIGTIVYFSYLQTPEDGSIWFEVRQNIDNFRSALGI